MPVHLKPIEQQVIVLVGASSGIGLATARIAAERGARVVLAARDEESLARAVDQIEAAGGSAMYVAADVADEAAVRHIADAALDAYGRIDTWVNIAGVSIYGKIWEVPEEDARRLFETNYWGVVHGSLVALEALREHGGALINIGSVLSERAIPLQGHYSASKHAVKGFTESLRMEVEKEGVPISVSLVKPGSIATPFPEHAQNYMDAEPSVPPPVYAPDAVAEAILECAQRRVRDVVVGAGGRMITAMSSVPRLGDYYMETIVWEQQQAGPRNGHNGASALYEPSPSNGRERGDLDRHVMETSLYTRAVLNPWKSLAIAATAGAGLLLARRLG